MIVVKVELWPLGDESRKKTLGTAHIANDGSKGVFANAGEGAYNVTLLTGDPPLSKKAGRVWKRGRVEGFPRLRLGPWDLLYRALREIVGGRNL